jgi:hypothetical protein
MIKTTKVKVPLVATSFRNALAAAALYLEL